MNKLTLLSLSLLMISACTAVWECDYNQKQDQQTSQEQKPNLKLTRRVFGVIKQAKEKRRDEIFNDESRVGYSFKFKQEQFKNPFSLGEDNYIYPLRAHFILRKRRDKIDVVTEFDIHGEENIKQFEKEYNFREDKPTDGTLFNRNHAHDDRMSCEVRHKNYLDEDTNHRSYECVVRDMTSKEFEDILDDLETSSIRYINNAYNAHTIKYKLNKKNF